MTWRLVTCSARHVLQEIEALKNVSIPRRPRSRGDRAGRHKAFGSLAKLLNALKTLLIDTESVTKTRTAELDLPTSLKLLLAHLRKELKVTAINGQPRLCFLWQPAIAVSLSSLHEGIALCRYVPDGSARIDMHDWRAPLLPLLFSLLRSSWTSKALPGRSM